MAELFEEYVRKTISSRIDDLLPGARVKNGNVEQVPLFKQGGANQVQPDIYVMKDQATVAVIDAKYKPTISAADRYEVLAFCEALQCKIAILVSPSNGDMTESFMGETLGGVRMFHLFFDVTANDLDKAEQIFSACLSRVMTAAGVRV